MPRIRTIKPQHWSDKELSTIPLQAHLLWIGTWNFSDDEGIFENDPLLIKSQVFPRRTDVRLEQVSQWLDQLVKARFIIPFVHENIGYYIHRTFKTHQKIDKPQKSKIPDDIIRGIVDERSENDQPCIVKESKGKEGKGGEPPPAPDDSGKYGFIIEIFKPDFIPEWEKWKDYKAKEFKFKFKSLESEKASFSELLNLSEKKQAKAIAIIQQSMANGWKGFFELKNELKPPPPNKTQLPKVENELNYLYETFREGRINISSMDDEHFDHLRKTGIKYTAQQQESITRAAKEYTEENDFKNLSEDGWKSLQRRFAVIEYFKLLKAQGHVTVFRME